jgi:flagellar hook-length control protein FliK
MTTPQAAKATAAAGDSSYDSNAAVGSLGVAGASAAAGATAAPLSAAQAAAGSSSAQSAANLSVVADNGKHPHAGSDIPTLGGTTADAAAGLSQLSSNSAVSAPADAAPAPTLRIHASVDSSDFPQGLSDRVSWMVGNGMNGARLQVNPPQLGPIELRISVQGDHAQVWMTTHSAVTRDALEASSPKLREMLGAQGFGQVSVDISQRSFQDRSAYTPRYERAPADRSAVAAPAVSSTTTTTPRTSLSALDAYA